MTDYFVPGVYIDERPGPGIITGVGTSTAAFIGVAPVGPICVPTLITSWEEFVARFGRDGNPYVSSPREFFLAHAVRNYFDNDGAVAYIVRAGTATTARFSLLNSSGGIAIIVEARDEGLAGNNIQVTVSQSSTPASALVTAEAVVLSATNATMQLESPVFQVGDIISNPPDPATYTVVAVSGSQVRLDRAPAVGARARVRLADLSPGRTTFRIPTTVTGVFPGSVLALSGPAGSPTEVVVVASVRAGLVTLEGGITNGYALDTDAHAPTFVSNEFSLSVMGSALETFPGLSMDRRHPRFYGQFVQSSFVRVLPPSDPTTSVPADARPREVSAAPLHGGLDDDPRSLDPSHFDAAIEALDAIDGVNFIAIPDSQVAAVQQNLIDHCVTRGDRFAVLDAPFGRDLSDVLSHRDLVTSERGFAALYHPWVVVRDPQMRGQILSVPPSGCIAGIYARVDTQRGVHKAPANETVRGILTLERTVTERQQLVLNPAGVNVLRILPGGGQPLVWGARTTADVGNADWRYVNVRRLMLYLEQSIESGIRWAVFEPNNQALWHKVRRTITEFLTRVWRDGALFGDRPEHAFYVRVDEAINPDTERALGRLHVEIGVRPSYPAEFIVVRIGLWDGGAALSEV